MNYDDYAVQARMIEDIQKERFGINIQWTEELYLTEEEPGKEWLVFCKVNDPNTKLPRGLIRLGENGNLEYKNYPNQ